MIIIIIEKTNIMSRLSKKKKKKNRLRGVKIARIIFVAHVQSKFV